MPGTTRLFALVLFWAVSFRLVTLHRPFHYDSEATGGAFYGIMARNYLRFPLSATHGMPVVTVGHLAEVPLVFYADHSPLVPWLIAPVYYGCGVGEWQTRLPTAIATVLTITGLYLLGRRVGTERAALLAAAFFAATPMVLYFGGQPEVLGMPLVLCAVGTVFAYLPFHREPTPRTLGRLTGVFTLAALSDWPAFLLVPVLAGHFVTTRPRRTWPWVLAWAMWAVVVFVLLNGYMAWAAHLRWDWIVPVLKGRTAIGTTAPFTAGEWFRIAWIFNRHFHTVPLLAAASLWLVAGAARLWAARPGDTVARLLIAWGALHVAMGRQGVYNHEWWWWPLTPGIAVASGLLVDRLLAMVESRQASRLPHLMVGIAVVLFAVRTTSHTYGELYAPHRDDPFTTVELGRAIRTAAPDANDLAMLAWSGDDPELWFYGDRPLRGDIWTVDEFMRRRTGPYADLVFGDLQQWPAPAAGLVFPARWRRSLADFHAYLVAHYPQVRLPPDLASKFEVFDLTR